jgi:hypothetical protein
MWGNQARRRIDHGHQGGIRALREQPPVRDARDWQDGQAALADHPTIGPWLRGAFKGEALAVVQSIIRDAEDELTGEGVELNY